MLANDVTVEYSKAENDWHEVVEEGETAQINMRRAYDVEIAAPTTANTWGMRVNLFRGTSHPEPFTETATDNSAGRIKASARTDEGWSLRGYWINRLQFRYYTADGNEITSSAKDEIFYTESGVVIRPNQLTGGSEGDRLILKRDSERPTITAASTPITAWRSPPTTRACSRRSACWRRT